jgi:hypothetical protein
VAERIRRLALEEAATLARTRGGRAPELAKECADRGDLYLYGIAEPDQFLDIAWQELAAKTKAITQGGQRTLRDVAQVVLDRYGSFAELIKARPAADFDPGWFLSCAEIEAHFDWSRWAEPWLVPATPGDHGGQTTEWYVWEGVHSTIVLAKGLIDNSIEWQPMEAVVCLHRPG